MKKLIPSLLFVLMTSLFTHAQETSEMDEAGLHQTRMSLKHSFDTLYKRNKDPEASENQNLKILDSSFSVPVYQTENFSTSIFGKLQEFHFASLPPNTLTTANDFYDQQYGIKLSYKEDQDKTWHLNTAYGSASDKTFESGDVSTFSMTLVRKETLTPTSSLALFLNYSNNRPILNKTPLPGFAYAFSNEERTQGWLLGFPFCLYWARPADRVSTSVFFLLPSAFRANIGYMFSPPFQVNLKLQYGQEVFIPTNRPDKEVRLFYETKKFALGLKTILGIQKFFELELAKVIDRSMFQGKSSFNLTSDRLSLADEWQLTGAFQFAL